MHKKRLNGVIKCLAALFIFCLLCPQFGVAKQAKTVRIAYVPWYSEIASSNVVKAVLQEKMGYDCKLVSMEADTMWKAVGNGDVDGMVAAWLPGTHGHYLQKVEGNVVDLGPNLEGTKIGLVVPDVPPGKITGEMGIPEGSYITIDSIPELKDHAEKFNGRIIGIDPAAGIMKKTKEAMEAYDLYNYELIDGSEISMTAELADGVRNRAWVVVTGWTPHWMFARWDLKYLKDPKNIYGGEEAIHTIVRKGLKKDMPEVYAFLDSFYWTPEEMNQVMIWNQLDQGMNPYGKAVRWVRSNPERVQSWLDQQ